MLDEAAARSWKEIKEKEEGGEGDPVAKKRQHWKLVLRFQFRILYCAFKPQTLWLVLVEK